VGEWLEGGGRWIGVEGEDGREEGVRCEEGNGGGGWSGVRGRGSLRKAASLV
jgi:hypothetical protein